MTKAQRDIKRKLRVLKYAQEIKNISKTCRYFGISRQPYYEWKQNYAQYGEQGLINSKPYPENPTLRVPQKIEKRFFISERPTIWADRRSPSSWNGIMA